MSGPKYKGPYSLTSKLTVAFTAAERRALMLYARQLSIESGEDVTPGKLVREATRSMLAEKKVDTTPAGI